MNNRDFLLLLTSRSDNHTLRSLSLTPIWLEMREFVNTEYFWYLRVQHLVSRELQSREGNWKQAYYLLEVALQKTNPYIISIVSDKLSVEILLELGHDPSMNNGYTLTMASREGYLEVVQLLLDHGVDPSLNNNCAIRLASRDRRPDVVKLLLLDKRVDPSALQNESIRHASMNGYIEVVELLLPDPRVISAGL